MKYTSKLLLLMTCMMLLSSVASAGDSESYCDGVLATLDIGIFYDNNFDGV